MAVCPRAQRAMLTMKIHFAMVFICFCGECKKKSFIFSQFVWLAIVACVVFDAYRFPRNPFARGLKVRNKNEMMN